MKKLFKVTFVAAFAAIAGYGVYANQKSDAMSDLALANVEALAGGEGVEITCSRSCSDGVGKCWIRSNSGYCAFTGYQADSCSC
ncbi:MAG: NVEALA domain-containing protein [Bacteroides sp.]|nr:NVEALA domain-containing protein [Bacteroides sp.]